MSGGLTAINTKGTSGLTLRDKWKSGISAYLGRVTHGFPNMTVCTERLDCWDFDGKGWGVKLPCVGMFDLDEQGKIVGWRVAASKAADRISVMP